MTTLDDIVAKLDLEALFGKYLPSLKTGYGTQATALCPKHNDTNPSLSLELERGLYNCHRCDFHGNLITFMAYMEEIDNREATRRLAKMAGIELKGSDKTIVAEYDYLDEQANLLYQTLRYEPKDFRARRPDGQGWKYSMGKTRRVLFNLPEVVRADSVYVTEGEKDAEAIIKLGLVGTTNPFGADKWRDDYSESLAGKQVYIIPDNDSEGEKHAEHVAGSVLGIAQEVKIVHLDGLHDKGDISDWIKSRLSEGKEASAIKEELGSIAEDAPMWEPKDGKAQQKRKKHKGASKKKKRSSRKASSSSSGEAEEEDKKPYEILMEVAHAKATFFNDQHNEPFAQINIGKHHESWPVKSKYFRNWLFKIYFDATGKGPNNELVSAVKNTLLGEAQFSSEQFDISNRVAFKDGVLYYDLADRKWRVVSISTIGWEVKECEDKIFRRYSHQQAQVEPSRELFEWKQIFKYLNIREEHQLLFSVWLCSAFLPHIPHPALIFHGVPGSAKSTAAGLTREIIDPSAIGLLRLPRDQKELIQLLSHNWASFFDNLSSIPTWISDELCVAVTSGGFVKRELYSDDDDVVYQFRRVVCLNGINIVAVKSDLLNRSILIELDEIPKEKREEESDIKRNFEHIKPGLLGAIFTALSKALQIKDSVKLEEKPRMADFAVWGYAIAEALGFSGEAFLKAYNDNISRQKDVAISSSPVATALMEFMKDREEWKGAPSDLLSELEIVAQNLSINTRQKFWPKSPNWLTNRLNEIRVDLKAKGLVIERGKGDDRFLEIRRRPESIDGATGMSNNVEKSTATLKGISEEGMYFRWRDEEEGSLYVVPLRLQKSFEWLVLNCKKDVEFFDDNPISTAFLKAAGSFAEAEPKFRVGNLIQWKSNGKFEFIAPLKIVGIKLSIGRKYYYFVEGNSCEVPESEIVRCDYGKSDIEDLIGMEEGAVKN